MTWTESNYIKTVRDIAKEAIKEHPFDDQCCGNENLHDEEREQYVRESVDGNEYVSYYSANEIALRASQNEPDGDEVSAMSAANADWRTMRTTATYLAMQADVMEQIQEIWQETYRS